MRAAAAAPEVRFESFPLEGGLDQHTPQLSLKPGVAREAVGWELSITGGYRRMDGYERFDGRPSPSAATYVALEVNITGALVVGDAVNGQTSGATGVVAAIDGSTVAVTKLVGTFVAAENLRTGVTVQGTITTAGVAVTDRVKAATYLLASTNIYRADIAAVPGSGQVRGVLAFGSDVFAWRDNAGGTACVLHKASGSGWTAVSLGYELSFTAGSGTPPAEGATITKGAVSAVVRRVVLETGSWSGGTAAGRFIINTPSGGSFSAGAFTAGVTATCSGAEAAITLAPGGRYEFDTGDCGNGVRAYGASGTHRAFEFDGTVYVPIVTGMATDTPSHVRVHKNHLMLSYGPSSQNSGTGLPYQWTAGVGAAEVRAKGNITGYGTLPGSQSAAALLIASDNTTEVLYGTSSADWNLTETPFGVGARAYSVQTLGPTFFFDTHGVVQFEAVQEFGNFGANGVTTNIRRFVSERRTLVSESAINRERGQYRVFFSDGYALFVTIKRGRVLGAMPIRYNVPVLCVATGQAINGGEVAYFGSSDGFVYSMDIGTSADGAALDTRFALAFTHMKHPRLRKRFRGAMLELQGDGYSQFQVGYALGWADANVDQPADRTFETQTDAVFWDLFTWDLFTWDGRTIAPTDFELEGVAENVSIAVSQSSALWPSTTINSVTVRYSPRRIMRP